MSTWLDTDRCRPGWLAVLHLLADDAWHDQDDAIECLRHHSGLSPRTVANHLRSASARGWIVRRQGLVKLGPTPPTDLVPTSSPPRPGPRPMRTSSLVPSPLGDEDEREHVPHLVPRPTGLTTLATACHELWTDLRAAATCPWSAEHEEGRAC